MTLRSPERTHSLAVVPWNKCVHDTFAEFQYSYHYGDMHSPYIKMTEPLKVECEHFMDCIKTGRKPLTGGPQGLQVVQILEAAKQSLAQGGAAVEISFEEE